MTGVDGMPEAKQEGTLRGVLPAGTALRGYELKSILGQGAFGITYRARDLTLGRDVAIKEYLPTSLALREGRTTVLPRSPDHAEQFAWGRERFLDEARTLARLDRTPAIVRVHDFLEDNGTAYMVMALIEGETLNKRLMREQKLAPEVVEGIVFPLLDGLEEVHGIGFLHRDIKPANIMLDGNGRPTLIDFGASRAAMAERSTTLTAIFTPGYAAAEQFTSATTLGPWTDIYGLSATLYHAITGQIPPSAIDRILNDSYRPLTELQPAGFDPALLAGIDAGMAVRVDDRPQSIAEWRHMLRASSVDATHVARRPSALRRVARKTGKARLTIRGPALWGGLAAAILLVSGAGYLAVTYNAPPTVNAAAVTLSAEQLEQALAERRKADMLAAEKRRLEEDARRKAEADAAAKQQADEELEKARQARVKAEQELAELKASIEARRQGTPEQRDQPAAAQRAAEEAAQRKAEVEAAALRQAEEEATKKAEIDAEAKRQADQALAMAEAQRQQAEAEARAKAEAEVAARQQASEEAQRKAEADAAARRQSDEAQAKAQAEREKAEADEKIKAEAAAAARLREEAEATERTLRLDRADRERLQLALTSLSFDTRGSDGILGPRSRDMIAAWQKARNQPPTGFLTGPQQQALLKEAAAALSKYDEQKKADEEAKARTSAAPLPVTQPGAAGSAISASVPDGTYTGTLQIQQWLNHFSVQMINGGGTGTLTRPGCTTTSFWLKVDPTGNVTGEGRWPAAGYCANPPIIPITGRADGRRLRLTFPTGEGGGGVQLREVVLSRDAAAGTPPPLASPDASSAPAASGQSIQDGVYSAAITNSGPPFRADLLLRLTAGRGTITITSAGCSPSVIPVSVSADGALGGEGEFKCILMVGANTLTSGNVKVSGRRDGNTLRVTFRSDRGSNTAVFRQASASAAQPSPYDGAYSSNTNIVGYSGSASRVVFSLQVSGGRGTGTLSSPGCNPSPISLTVSPTGAVTGEGMLNCVLGAQSVTGPLAISGDLQRKPMVLRFISERGSLFSLTLAAGTAAPSALASPDGLWRGTYACEASVQPMQHAAFRTSLDVQVSNGEGTWRPASPTNENGQTFDLRVTVDQSKVSMTRTYAASGSGISGRATLQGTFDGNAIRAEGSEQGQARPCVLDLKRV